MTTSLAAQEIRPDEVGLATPVQNSGTPQPATPGQSKAIKVNHLPPIDRGKYRDMKLRAPYNPDAQEADQVMSPPETGPAPLSAVIATKFKGLDRLSAANHGFIFTPPDTIVAKSPTRVLEAVNSALRLSNTSGGTIATADLNTFFGATVANGLLFDPKLYFDRNATNQRFYVVALQQSTNPNVSRIWLAVSRGTNPANLSSANWCRYSINAKRNVGTANESWADYPCIGAGRDAFTISANQFRFIDSSFTFAVLRVFNKNLASNNAGTGSCPSIATFTFQPTTTAGDGSVFTLQPVQHYTSPTSFSGTTNPAYLVNTVFGTSNLYRVWRVRNVAGGSPTLQGPTNVFGGFNYGLQPDAPQTGSTVPLETGDNRLTQAAGLADAVWGVHGTLCNIGAGPNESCVRALRILVGQSGGALTASINQQRTIGSTNEFYWWPGLAINNEEQTAMPFQFVSPTRTAGRLSSWWTMKDLTSSNFEPISSLTTGTCAETLTNPDRTGDYVGAQTDPSDFHSFWLAGERATSVGGTCQWQTQIIKLVPSSGTMSLIPLSEEPQTSEAATDDDATEEP
jgi:hypothetical protein